MARKKKAQVGAAVEAPAMAFSEGAGVNRKTLLNAISWGQKFISKQRHVIEEERMVRVVVGDGDAILPRRPLTVEARSKDMWIAMNAGDVDASAPLAACVEPERIAPFLSLSRVEEVHLSTEVLETRDTLRIQAGKNVMNLVAGDLGKFPSVDRWEPGDRGQWAFHAGDLQRAVERIDHATDKDSTRYALGGIYFSPGEKETHSKMTLVATDGRRIGVVDIMAEVIEDADPIVVPARSLALACKLALEGEEPTLRFRVIDKARVVMQAEKGTVTARLIEGRFPKYQDVLTFEVLETIEVETAGLLRVAQQAACMTSDDRFWVDLRFAEDLELTTQSPDVGRSIITLPLEGPDVAREPKTARIHAAYLVQALKSMEPGEPTRLDLGGENDTFVLRQENFIYGIARLTPEATRPGKEPSPRPEEVSAQVEV